MTTQNIQLERLEGLFKLANQSYVKPEELKSLFEAFTYTIKELRGKLADSIKFGDEELDQKVIKSNSSILKDIRDTEKRIGKMITDNQRTGDKRHGSILKTISDEISNVKALIPKIPEIKIPDISELNKKIKEHEGHIANLITSKDMLSMKEELKEELAVEFKKINDLEKKKHYAEGLMGKSLSNLVDVNVAGITSGQTIQWNGIQWVAATGGSGGTFLKQALTGTINGINKTFTFPTSFSGSSFIDLNGTTQSDSGTDYSVSGTTVTYVTAPPSDLSGTTHVIYSGGGTSSSSSAVQIVGSGAVNGVNKTFVWTTAPSIIVVDEVPLQKVSSSGTVNWTGTTTTVLSIAPTFDIYSITGTASATTTGYQVPTSGIVNGVNKVFSFTIIPNVIVVDGVSLQQITKSGTVNWTGAGTVTLSIAPTFDVFGIS